MQGGWLVNNFHTILLPVFETSRMVKKLGRKLNTKTARNMLCWAHFRFRQRLLLHKLGEHPTCKVYLCDQIYTSKTCGGNCGKLHLKLGSSNSFKCPYCGEEMDRDINAARNILLRWATMRYNEGILTTITANDNNNSSLV